MYHRDYGIAD